MIENRQRVVQQRGETCLYAPACLYLRFAPFVEANDGEHDVGHSTRSMTNTTFNSQSLQENCGDKTSGTVRRDHTTSSPDIWTSETDQQRKEN